MLGEGQINPYRSKTAEGEKKKIRDIRSGTLFTVHVGLMDPVRSVSYTALPTLDISKVRTMHCLSKLKSGGRRQIEILWWCIKASNMLECLFGGTTSGLPNVLLCQAT